MARKRLSQVAGGAEAPRGGKATPKRGKRAHGAPGGPWRVQHVERPAARQLLKAEVGPEGLEAVKLSKNRAELGRAIVWVDPQPGASPEAVAEVRAWAEGFAVAVKGSTAVPEALPPAAEEQPEALASTHREVAMKLARMSPSGDVQRVVEIVDAALTAEGL